MVVGHVKETQDPFKSLKINLLDLLNMQRSARKPHSNLNIRLKHLVNGLILIKKSKAASWQKSYSDSTKFKIEQLTDTNSNTFKSSSNTYKANS